MALLSAFVASCSSAGGPALEASGPSFAGATAGGLAMAESSGSDSGDNMVMSSDTATSLPETVAYVPATSPNGALADIAEAAADSAPALADPTGSKSQAAQAAASDAQAQSAAAATAGDEPQARKEAVPVPADYPVYVTATDPGQPIALASQPAKRSFFASLFGTTKANAAPLAAEQPKPVVALAPTGSDAADKAATSRDEAEVKVASLGAGASEPMDALPGVRQSALFEIKRKSGLDDDSDIDLNEDEDHGPVRVATAAGLARLAPNGLITQTDQVDVACLKPSLVRVLKTVESHYGKKLVVTSGYRSPEHNRRARGARNSLHMFCAAADIVVPGVTKWELANYLRTMPGRGGVGTYCYTDAVHIDVGPERDWNWRCRRRRA
jgi:uncharacterized protein YcbK (DUF882 family)